MSISGLLFHCKLCLLLWISRQRLQEAAPFGEVGAAPWLYVFFRNFECHNHCFSNKIIIPLQSLEVGFRAACLISNEVHHFRMSKEWWLHNSFRKANTFVSFGLRTQRGHSFGTATSWRGATNAGWSAGTTEMGDHPHGLFVGLMGGTGLTACFVVELICKVLISKVGPEANIVSMCWNTWNTFEEIYVFFVECAVVGTLVANFGRGISRNPSKYLDPCLANNGCPLGFFAEYLKWIGNNRNIRNIRNKRLKVLGPTQTFCFFHSSNIFRSPFHDDQALLGQSHHWWATGDVGTCEPSEFVGEQTADPGPLGSRARAMKRAWGMWKLLRKFW